MARRGWLLFLFVMVLSACAGPEESANASAAGTPTSSAGSPSVRPSPLDPGTGITAVQLLRVQVTGLRMRSEPTTTAPMLATLPEGATVSVIAGPDAAEGHDWYHVRFGMATGWLASGPEHDWLAVIRNGRIGFSCLNCGGGGAAAFATINPDGSDLRVLQDRPESASWAPDGSRVAVTYHPGDTLQVAIALFAADGTRLRDLGPGAGPVWSPDAKRLAFVNEEDGTIVLVDGDSSPMGIHVSDFGASGTLAWSPDGKRLAFTAIDCPACTPGEPIMGEPAVSVYAFEPPGGEVVKLAEDGGGELHWSPNGTAITFVAYNLSIGRWELREVQLSSGQVSLLAADLEIDGYEWSPDFSRFATWGYSSGIVISNRDGTERAVVVPNDPRGILTPYSPSWSPDGQWILFTMAGSDATYPRVVWTDGSDAHELVDTPASGAAWQPLLEALP